MLESPIRPAMRSPLQQALDRIGSAPAVWTPATLFAASEQGVWYDPSDLSTLFQDSAGTVPVTATGQPVGRILDKSGRGNHATQATTASKPILQQDANGKYYLAFDGVDDGMATAAVDFTGTDKMTVVEGQRSIGLTGMHVALGGSIGVGSFYVFTNAVSNYEFARRASGAAEGTSTGVISLPDTSVLTYGVDFASATEVTAQRRNGAALGSVGSADTGSGNFSSAALFIGRHNASALPFNGRIYQLIIRGALTDAAGITAAEAFVNTKTAAY